MRVPFQYASATATVNMVADDIGFLNSVYARDRRMGHASGLMEQVISWADGKDVTLHLTAQGYGNGRIMHNQDLIAFYERFGFRRVPGDNPWPARMVRLPSRTIHAP
jgi:GNAT superfamily N-acetyltransferase